MGDEPARPGWWEPDFNADPAVEPLKRFPRMNMPHRWDDLSRQMLLHPAIGDVLRVLMNEEPVAAQSMWYYKPPGARGQAYHQDNYYLVVQPGTCFAAWIAIDPATPENGGLMMIPGTQNMSILCPEIADAKTSFTRELIKPPEGMDPVPTFLEPGDVMFFNGSIVHGSGPNQSASTWRRSFICHYLPTSSTHIPSYFKPLLQFDGSEYKDVQNLTGGGPCGTEFVSSYEVSDLALH